jgi:DNA-binding LacI/PurR family transcriptional regulator
MSSQPTARMTPVTQRDIARHLQISQQAVSRALRHDPRISEETVARVLAAAEELGYDITQHQAARRMALIKVGGVVSNHLVCLLAHETFSEANYFSELFRGILQGLNAQGYDLVTSHSDGNHDTLTIPRSVRRGDVDGLISMVRPEATAHLLNLIRPLPTFGDRPVVSLMWPVPGALHVGVDDEQAGYLAMRHLLELGHRHIGCFAFIGGEDDPEIRRRTGMHRALSEAGLAPAEVMTPLRLASQAWLTPPPFSDLASPAYGIREPHDTTPAMLIDTLRRHPDMTAIIALNDASAICAWYQLERAGLRVPDDISLVGFDDTDPMLDNEGRNVLTTVRVPLRQIGQEAAKLLLCATRGEDVGKSAVIMAPELVIRRSTKAAPLRSR